MGQRVPHPKAPTIDHIVPVSEGGDDTRANVQLACFRCNSVKGPRGSQQLALIG
jgi:5-methylcytosine-specific restriction endonuclease McrA